MRKILVVGIVVFGSAAFGQTNRPIIPRTPTAIPINPGITICNENGQCYNPPKGPMAGVPDPRIPPGHIVNCQSGGVCGWQPTNPAPPTNGQPPRYVPFDAQAPQPEFRLEQMEDAEREPSSDF